MNVCVLLDLQQRLTKMTISIIMILLEAFCFINPSCYCVIVKYNMLVICNVIAGHDAFRLNGQGFQNMPLLNEVLSRLTTFFICLIGLMGALLSTMCPLAHTWLKLYHHLSDLILFGWTLPPKGK